MERMVDVAIQCAWGLEHAHAEGLTHHDAKAANVMLSRDGTVKVTHPGLAGTTGASGLRSWALSVLEMLTGGRALDADATGREALVALARGGPADPRLPPVPASLLSLLRRCLQPDPADRPATIGQVAEALIDLHADTFGTRYPRARPEDVILPADALCNQALSMLELGRRERADALWDLALQVDPRHLHSLYNRGLDRWRRERMADEQLVAELAACLGDGCDEPAAGHLLARVHLERGDSESALAVLDEAVRAAPADEHVHEAIELARRHVATRGPQSLLTHDKRLSAAALTADGRLALTGCVDGTLRMWQLRGGGVVRTLPAHESSVRSIALSCDGERAVSADSNGVVRAWDVLQERCVHMAETGVERPAIALSGDGRVVVYSAPGTVRVWEPASGRDTRTIVCSAVMALALSADGRRAVSTGFDGQLRVWDIPAGRCLRAITAGTGYVVGSTVRRATRLIDKGEPASAISALRSARNVPGHERDRALLDRWQQASRTGRRTSVRDGWQLHALTLLEHRWSSRAAALSADGRLGLSADTHGEIRVWDLAAGSCVGNLCVHDGSAESIALGTDGRYAIDAVALSADGRFAVSGSEDGAIRVWELETGRCLRTLRGHTRRVHALALSADGHLLMSASSDGTRRVWELDWEYEFPAAADWDERARPRLEAYIATHALLHPGCALTPADHELAVAEVADAKQLVRTGKRQADPGAGRRLRVSRQIHDSQARATGPARPLQ